MKEVDTASHGLAQESHNQWPGLTLRSFPAKSCSFFRSFLGLGDTEHLPQAGATRRSQRSPHFRACKGQVARAEGGAGESLQWVRGHRSHRSPRYLHGDPEDGLQSPGLSPGDTRHSSQEPDGLGQQDGGTAPARRQDTYLSCLGTFSGTRQHQVPDSGAPHTNPGASLLHPPNPVRFCETSGNQRSAIQPDPGMASSSNSRLRECESAQRPSGISMEKMIIAVPMEDEVL